jgi:hypothetical protein
MITIIKLKLICKKNLYHDNIKILTIGKKYNIYKDSLDKSNTITFNGDNGICIHCSQKEYFYTQEEIRSLKIESL